MRAYRVIVRSRSAILLGTPRKWSAEEFQLTVTDHFGASADGGKGEHIGFKYVVDLNADDIVSAIRRSTVRAAFVADQIAMVHGAAVDTPHPCFALGATPGTPGLQLAQVFETLPAPYQPRRLFNHAVYESVFTRLDSLRSTHTKDALRVDRALHFLNNSYLAEDPFDQFENAWTALEAINHLIVGRYGLKTKHQSSCPKCKLPLYCKSCSSPIEAPDNASGISYIVAELLGEGNAAARKLKDRRNDIVHSRTKLSSALEGLGDMTRLARRAVSAGVADILDLPDEHKGAALRETLPLSRNSRVLAVATLHTASVDDMQVRAHYPQLHIVSCEVIRGSESEPDLRGSPPRAIQLCIGLQDYSGTWDIDEVLWTYTPDLEQAVADIQLLAVKATTRESTQDGCGATDIDPV